MSIDAGDSPGEILTALLDGNDRHVAEVDVSAFDAVRDAQHPPVVSVCCSDSRVSQEGMWDIDDPGTMFTVANIGNRATTRVDGQRVLDGGVAYSTAFTDTDVVVIVGHTGCGAITAAYEIVRGETDPPDLSPGVRNDLESLVSLVESAPVDLDGEKSAVVDRLAEYNVSEQVAFVSSQTDATVYGFVYDFHGRYGDEVGRTYLVATGEGSPSEAIDDNHTGFVEPLL
jgi:carbonic anhydrase